MILDDVFAELNDNHNVPLQDLNAVTLQTLLELLQKARAERTEQEEYRLAAEQKEARLRETIRHLSAVNAAQTVKLLASLDSLEVLQHRNKQDDSSSRERAALVVLNQSLSARLRDANAEIARLASSASTSGSCHYANDRPAIARATERYHTRRQHPQPTQDDDADDSDTPTEVRYTPESKPSLASEREMLYLRTRTIVFELTRELEACRIRSERDASEKAETTELLEAHIASRDKELRQAYNQLDELYGADVPLIRAMPPNAPPVSDVHDVLASLSQQAEELRADIIALNAERSRLTRFTLTDSAAADELSAPLEESLDDLADRASAKLVEQKVQLQEAQAEIDSLHEALAETGRVAQEATEALEKEQSRRQIAEATLLGGTSETGRLRTRSSSQPDLFSAHLTKSFPND